MPIEKTTVELARAELAIVVLALAEYEDSGKRLEDFWKAELVNALRERLKKKSNEVFGDSWAI